jgi:hypothetical protein
MKDLLCDTDSVLITAVLYECLAAPPSGAPAWS